MKSDETPRDLLENAQTQIEISGYFEVHQLISRGCYSPRSNLSIIEANGNLAIYFKFQFKHVVLCSFLFPVVGKLQVYQYASCR